MTEEQIQARLDVLCAEIGEREAEFHSLVPRLVAFKVHRMMEQVLPGFPKPEASDA